MPKVLSFGDPSSSLKYLAAMETPMDGPTRFYNGGATVNEHLILELLKEHGDCVLQDTETPLARRFRSDWDGQCKYGDILAVFRKNGLEYLVGIEVKDWKASVSPKMCYRYLKTYRKGCQYVYIAARRFSPRAFDIHELGFIDLDRMEVIKRPEYLYPRKRDRAKVLRGMRGAPRPGKRWLRHPDQATVESFGLGRYSGNPLPATGIHPAGSDLTGAGDGSVMIAGETQA